MAIADVDALVKKDSPIDKHAHTNTTSIYTGVKIFPMLPEKLSTNLTSLGENESRLATVIEMVVNQDGHVVDSSVYRAKVKNKAKLAYNAVAAWLDGKGPLPAAASRVSGMDAQLRIQDGVGQLMRAQRFEHGALELETIKANAIIENGIVVDVVDEKRNRAHQLIEDFMVGANGVTARFLAAHQCASMRRVVKSPERWARIVQVAKDIGDDLPSEPDAKSLADFLSRRKKADPLRFADLSLAIVKLLGRGEYVLQRPREALVGHFALAVSDYTHSTAPNRRYPDLVTQRLLAAILEKQPPPYTDDELSDLAKHCTVQEDAANKVERQVRKSTAALLLSSRIGEHFDAIVTGASEKGTWARVFSPPVEGRVSQGYQGSALRACPSPWPFGRALLTWMRGALAHAHNRHHSSVENA